MEISKVNGEKINMQLQRSWTGEPKKRYLKHSENLKQRKYRDLTPQKVKKFEALGYLLRKYHCYWLNTFGFLKFRGNLCTNTQEPWCNGHRESAIFSLSPLAFSKPFRLLQWGGILMKLAVCSDRSGDMDSDEIISIRDDAARRPWD